MIRAFLVATAVALIFAGSACGGDKAEPTVPLSPSAVATTVATSTATATVSAAPSKPTVQPPTDDGIDEIRAFCALYGEEPHGAAADFKTPVTTTDGYTIIGVAVGVCTQPEKAQLAGETFGPYARLALDAAALWREEWSSEELADFLADMISDMASENPNFASPEWFFLTKEDKGQVY